MAKSVLLLVLLGAPALSFKSSFYVHGRSAAPRFRSQMLASENPIFGALRKGSPSSYDVLNGHGCNASPCLFC